MNKYKQAIIDNDIIGTHLATFGSFNVKELMEKNPLCFKPQLS